MKVIAHSQTWHSLALDRQRSLALTAPFQDLDANKGHIGAQQHDLRSYCLYVIDRIVLGMRAQRGERFDAVEEALGKLIVQCQPEVSEEMRGRLIAYVIDGLLNAKRRGPFIETLTEFAPDGTPRRVKFAFTLVETKDIGDQSFYLIASPLAIRLYTDLLARDVTDEQVANEYLFRFLVERGEWQKAAEESVRMELLSIEYDQTVRRAVDQSEMNVRIVQWKETMVPVLQRARQHVSDRIRSENSVLASLRDKLAHDEAMPAEDRPKLTRVEETLNGVINRHTRLAETLLEANRRFAAAQDAQCYRPRTLHTLAHVGEDLLHRLLLTPMGRLCANADDFSELMFRAEPRPLFSLVEIVERLMQAEQERHEPDTDREGDLIEAEIEPPFLNPEVLAAAETFLGSISRPCELSDVLGEMAAQGLEDKTQDLVVTTLLKSVGVPDCPLRVASTGRKIDTPRYAGDELAIIPAAA